MASQQQFGASSYSAPPSGSHAHADDKLAKVKDPLLTLVKWFKDRSPQEKMVLGVIGGIVLLLVLWRWVGAFRGQYLSTAASSQSYLSVSM